MNVKNNFECNKEEMLCPSYHWLLSFLPFCMDSTALSSGWSINRFSFCTGWMTAI